MAGEEDVTNDLGRFLRSRRERLTPEEVGLPPGPRRRTRGLRREEVAVLAGVSVTWYTYLEQGRGREVSPGVLDSIARALRLTEDERRHLQILAYGRVHTPHPLEGELPGDVLVKMLVESTGTCPYPVYGLNLYCDILAWNNAVNEWYDDWGKIPPGQRNMMRWLITSPAARDRIMNWEGVLRDGIARWRAMMPAWRDDTRLKMLIREFTQSSAEFNEWWHKYEVLAHRTTIREFRHKKPPHRHMRIIVVEAAEFTPSFVVFHLPEQ